MASHTGLPTGWLTASRPHPPRAPPASSGDSTGLLGAISASSMYREDEDYRALGEKIRKKAMELTRLLAGDESVS